MRYDHFFKRGFDFLIALLILTMLSPILIIVILFLLFANQGHPFFFQNRPGKNARIFKVIKFKSMNDKKDAKGKLLPDAQRLTKVGALIRKTSLDEIPQLINVLRGDMSLVGPRPLLVSYLPFYTARESRRHEVRPGITGWAQIHGRNRLSWDQKLEYDVEYVENISFLLDLKILLRTVKNVFKSEGVVVISDEVEPYLDEERAIHG